MFVADAVPKLQAMVAGIQIEDYFPGDFVLQADRLSAPPVARVKMPVPLRPQVHGWWVSAAERARSKHR